MNFIEQLLWNQAQAEARERFNQAVRDFLAKLNPANWRR